jgi:hypothetical protein
MSARDSKLNECSLNDKKLAIKKVSIIILSSFNHCLFKKFISNKILCQTIGKSHINSLISSITSLNFGAN